MRYLSENEKKQWDNIRKQFPYHWKDSDLLIAGLVGGTIGLWVGFLSSLVL